MTKKSRRTRKRQSNRSRSVPPVELQASPAPAAAAGQQAEPTFQEYRYIVADLKRMVLLAAAIFALLIALSFFIG